MGERHKEFFIKAITNNVLVTLPCMGNLLTKIDTLVALP